MLASGEGLWEVGDTIGVPRLNFRPYSAAPPPPPGNPEPSALSGTAGSYMEEMYEAWTRDPKSVHASWDAYFRGSQYTAPPTVGTVSKRNECKQPFRIIFPIYTL